ncbi:MAG: hypothetical protein WD825_02040 [Gemmatimonadaceae bacterium]
MDTAAVDFPALLLATLVAGGITVALILAYRGDNARRLWIAAGAVALLLLAVGLVDLLRATPRETHLAAPVVGVILPALGAVGMIRGTRRVRPWVRWLLVFATAFVLLFAGLLLGATVVPRFLPA